MLQNPEKLRIEYYPARRKIHFILFEENMCDENPEQEFPSLAKYTTERPEFTLSLCGKEFFDDILKPFAGKSTVPVSIKTTRIDYEDFKLMVDVYNGLDKKTKILLEKPCESEFLNDMTDTFKTLQKYSPQMYDMLYSAQQNMRNIQCNSSSSREYIERIADRIQREADNIYNWLQKLNKDNFVNLCFIGAYSSGKSTLINALLGYRILPEAIKSETAKMIRIVGVDKIENTAVELHLKDSDQSARLKWDSFGKKFCFARWDMNTEFKQSLLDNLYSWRKLKIHEQLYKILDFLNKQDIESLIDVEFPIPLNTNILKFVICDTPGSDSNYETHKAVLKRSLREQSNSIAIFVFKPDGIEGTANNVLLKEILSENQNAGTMIDMEHSFFVINKCDTAMKDYAELSNSLLPAPEDSDFSIDLRDKKLFFLSAMQAYCSRAMKNEIATEDDEDFFDNDVEKCYKSKNGKYYRHNHFGHSQFSTNKMISSADSALEKAVNDNDDFAKYDICSGIYSLEHEILRYGERHAFSTKTMALIKNMEDMLNSIRNMVKETEIDAKSSSSDIKDKLSSEIMKLKRLIEAKKKSFSEVPNNAELGIDSVSYEQDVVSPLMESLDKVLGRFFITITDGQKIRLVIAEISAIVDRYNEQYKRNRLRHLEKVRRNFIEELISDIENDESVSDELKKCVKNFNAPRIPDAKISEKIDELFGNTSVFNLDPLKKFSSDVAIWAKSKNEKISNSNIGAFKWFSDKFSSGLSEMDKNVQSLKTVDRKKFRNSVRDYLNSVQYDMTNGFREDYADSLTQLCSDIANEFIGNIERFSTKVKALKVDSIPLEKLAKEIEILNKNVQSFNFGGF